VTLCRGQPDAPGWIRINARGVRRDEKLRRRLVYFQCNPMEDGYGERNVKEVKHLFEMRNPTNELFPVTTTKDE